MRAVCSVYNRSFAVSCLNAYENIFGEAKDNEHVLKQKLREYQLPMGMKGIVNQDA
jgi:hypothetical protein